VYVSLSLCSPSLPLLTLFPSLPSRLSSSSFSSLSASTSSRPFPSSSPSPPLIGGGAAGSFQRSLSTSSGKRVRFSNTHHHHEYDKQRLYGLVPRTWWQVGEGGREGGREGGDFGHATLHPSLTTNPPSLPPSQSTFEYLYGQVPEGDLLPMISFLSGFLLVIIGGI